MGKNFIKFCDIETEKQSFHASKSSISIEDTNIKQIILSDEFLYTKEGSKYFVGYNIMKRRQCCVSCFRTIVGI